jgi:hypothetical protein
MRFYAQSGKLCTGDVDGGIHGSRAAVMEYVFQLGVLLEGGQKVVRSRVVGGSMPYVTSRGD